MLRHTLRALAVSASFVFAGAALGLPAADAERVYVRKDCTEAFGSGTETYASCVDNMEDLADWLYGERPTQTPPIKPVLIDIGPGEFGPFTCDGHHDITLRGAGRNITILRHGVFSGAAIGIGGCDRIHVQHLTAIATGVPNASAVKGFAKQGFDSGVTTTWTNVELIGDSYAWWEQDVTLTGSPPECTEAQMSTHWVYDSIFRNIGDGSVSYVFAATCSRTFLYATELEGPSNAITIGFQGDVRAYGGVLRAVPSPDHSFSSISTVVLNNQKGVFHMHGGVIVADASAATGNVNARAIQVGGGNSTAFVHTHETAFLVRAAGDGNAVRILNNPGAMVQSPSLHHPSADPPSSGVPGGAGEFRSTHGQDLFVETDCSADGDCEGGGSQAHLMVYDSSCTEKWRNVVTGRCRNDTGTP
jgi:hypothetical protein